MRIELLIFAGCPHAEAARQQLRRALAVTAIAESWTERDISEPGTPPDLAVMGSPTILIDGVDVAPAAERAGMTCRLYPGSDVVGAPHLDTIVAALQRK